MDLNNKSTSDHSYDDKTIQLYVIILFLIILNLKQKI